MAVNPEDFAFEAWNRYRAETTKEALGVLFPPPSEMDERLPFITELRGRPPEIVALYLAAVEVEGWDSIIEGRPMDWTRVNPAEFLRLHAPSIRGKRSEQAVKIAQGATNPEPKGSLYDRLRRALSTK